MLSQRPLAQPLARLEPVREHFCSLSESTSAQLAYLALLPIVLLAVPSQSLLSRFDPDPVTTATGLVALGLVPAAAVAALRGALFARRSLVLALPLVVALWSLGASDQFEARRATLQAALLALGFVIGAALDERGRVALTRGLVVATIAHLAPALFGHLGGASDALFGRLGNVGPTNQVALGGAVVGLWFVVHERGAWRYAGGAALLAFAAHAALAPVLAGLLTLALVLVVGAVLAPWPTASGGRKWSFATTGVLAVLFGANVVGPTTGPSAANVRQEVATEAVDFEHVGGAWVRALIWRTLPDVVVTNGPLGAGPGQFAAAYPPHRNPREALVSGHHTEVEQPHNDWLLVWVEYGWLGGIGATLLLALALVTARRALASTTPTTAALGAVVGALAIGATVHSPLLNNPASGLIAALCLGAARAATHTTPPLVEARVPRLALVAIAFAACVPALSFVRHGAALARATVEIAGGAAATLEPARALALVEALDQALSHAPNSTLANDLLRSRALAFTGADIDREIWLAIASNACDARLAARPFGPSGHVDRGLVALFGRAPSAAREAWHEALVYAPEHPGALTNLARFELAYGDAQAAAAHLDRLHELGHIDGGARREIVRHAVRNGASPTSIAIVLGLDPAAPSVIFDEGRLRSDELAQALAHHLWAHQFLDQSDLDAAARSLRQAVRDYVADGTDSALARVELAGAEWMTGRPDAARRELAALVAPHWTAPDLAVHVTLVEAVREAAR